MEDELFSHERNDGKHTRPYFELDARSNQYDYDDWYDTPDYDDFYDTPDWDDMFEAPKPVMV